MNTRIRLILLVAAMVLIIGCSGSNGSEDEEPLTVVTTTAMIADAAENIGGERVSVTALMGPGVDPHLYTASESDIKRIGDADLVLFNGLDLEANLAEFFARFDGQVDTVPVAESIDESLLIPVDAEAATYDPHVWFDVSLWMDVVEEVYRALKAADGEGTESYDGNYVAYRSELDELEAYIHDRIEELEPESRVLITAHDAFGYFGKAYGFEVRALQGIGTVSEAGAAHVRALADYVAERQVAAIFFETSVPRRNVEALKAAVRSRGFDVAIGGELFSDATGDPGTEAGTYLGMVRHNVDTIVDALKVDRDE